jgi:glutaredoxin 3
MNIKRTIKKNPLVLFGLSYCPYCHKAKELLAPYKPIVKDIDLDRNANGTRKALKKISGMKTFPQIFLKGRLLGGYEETSRKMQTRKVKKSLESLKPSASFF